MDDDGIVVSVVADEGDVLCPAGVRSVVNRAKKGEVNLVMRIV